MGIIEERIKQRESNKAVLSITPVPKNNYDWTIKCMQSALPFLPQSPKPWKRVLIEIDIVDKVLKDGRTAGATDVGLYLTGESFIHPKLTEMVALAKQLGYTYIYITTNGILADKNRMHALAKAGLNSIKFSINAGTPETYAEIHGRPQYARVLRNLKIALSCAMPR